MSKYKFNKTYLRQLLDETKQALENPKLRKVDRESLLDDEQTIQRYLKGFLVNRGPKIFVILQHLRDAIKDL